MRYAKIKFNDIVNGEGINVAFFTQGCPHHCPGCFNPETWNFDGGQEFTQETLASILQGISANGVKRNFSVLGGEPLCAENLFLTRFIIEAVRKEYPDIKIYLWTGYLYEELKDNPNFHLQFILDNIDVLIDGPYMAIERNITLPLRGSRNQKIIEFDRK